MLSAYAIGPHVWIVHTDLVADKETPSTLPIGSIVLTPGQAVALGEQMIEAAKKTRPRAKRSPKVKS